MTVATWLKQASDRLAAAGVVSPRLEAQVLAAHASGVSRAHILAHDDQEVSSDAEGMLERRLAREPLAYILGYREFYGRRFFVDPSVLIPRQDTEVLVDSALKLLKPGDRVLDLGTGSGCIAITLKLEFPRADVAGVDLSTAALSVALRNSDVLGAEIEWIQSDLLDNLHRRAFDLLVSNPPYVEAEANLDPEVRNFEPPIALFAGPDGLQIYRRLAKEASRSLAPGGSLILEVGHRQSSAVAAIMEAHGWVEGPRTRDLGGIERVLVFRRHNSS